MGERGGVSGCLVAHVGVTQTNVVELVRVSYRGWCLTITVCGGLKTDIKIWVTIEYKY